MELDEVIEIGAALVKEIMTDVANYSSGAITKAQVLAKMATYDAARSANRAAEDALIASLPK